MCRHVFCVFALGIFVLSCDRSHASHSGVAADDTRRTQATRAVSTSERSVSAILTKEEVGQVIGAPIVELNEVSGACEYHTVDPAV